MVDHLLRLGDPWLGAQIGRIVREARLLVGWSQLDLASRTAASQAAISRLETAASSPDLALLDRVLVALGIRGTLTLDAPHLEDRRRQREPVHARMVAYVARHLDRGGWSVATEVAIGDPPRGWIDVLAHRERDGAGLVGEIKGDVPDFGGLQRQVAFYAQAAPRVARQMGWEMTRCTTLVACLSSDRVVERLTDNRDLVRRSFPSRVAELEAWLRSAEAPMPVAPTIALVDPRSRRSHWLRPVPLLGRGQMPAYRDYAEAARMLAGPRASAGASTRRG